MNNGVLPFAVGVFNDIKSFFNSNLTHCLCPLLHAMNKPVAPSILLCSFILISVDCNNDFNFSLSPLKHACISFESSCPDAKYCDFRYILSLEMS